MKTRVEWNSKLHLQLADVFMNTEDNISCYDGCKQMAMDLFEYDYRQAIKLIIKEKGAAI